MAFVRPTLGALVAQTQQAILAQLPGADAALRRNNLAVLARVFAGGLHLVYGFLDWVARQVIPATAEGVYLERWCDTYGIARRGAAAAAGNVTLTGSNGAVLPLGRELTTAAGVRYATQAAATIASGTATVAVRAVVGGAAGNADAGAGLRLVIAAAGITGTAVVAAGGLTGGLDVEDDAALRERLLARIRTPPQGGSAADYPAWALTVPGVTRAWAYPRNRGPGTVDVAFVLDGRSNIIPLSGDVAAVQAAIDLRRPVTDDCVVFAPVAAPMNIAIELLSPDTPAIRAAILVELAAQIRRDAAPGSTIFRSRLIEAVGRAAGEASHTMTAPSANVTVTTGNIAVLGTVTFA